MTKFEYIKSLDDIEMAGRYICEELEKLDPDFSCDFCPWREDCGRLENGIVAWLKEEKTEGVRFYAKE